MKKTKKKTNGTERFFRALSDPDTWNRWRIRGKILLSRLAYSLVVLFAIDTIIAATTKTLLHPAIAIVGLLWIVLVTAIIWYRGGVVIDALFGAEVVNLEIKHTERHIKTGEGFRPGHDFVQALALLGIIGVFITSFFLFVPVWQSWGLFFTLLVVLVGWRCAATLAESTFDWNKVRVAYIVFTVGAVGMFFLVYSHEFMTGQALTVDMVRKGLQEGIGKLIFWPILLIIVGMMPKMPLRGLIKAAGIIGLLVILFVTFLMPIAKKELSAMEKEFGRSQKSSGALKQEIVKKEPITELVYATVIVPAGEIVNTHFFARARQRIHFTKSSGGSSDPYIPSYYVHGKDIDIPVFSETHSCQYPIDDYVWLRGGPVTAMVTLKK